MIQKIFVACPANFKTGGTELLHQLVCTLNNIYKIKSYIYYFNYDSTLEKTPTPEAFYSYVEELWVEKVEDSSYNLLIVPEIITKEVDNYKAIKKAIWWLSVDGFFDYNVKISSKKELYLNYLKKRVRQQKLSEYEKLYFNKFNVDYHLVQSHYAFSFLKNYKLRNVYFLSDYVNDLYLNEYKTSLKRTKEDIVVYNPAKGYEFTSKLIASAPEIKWIPIQKMSNDDVFELLSVAKLYIDFGAHPGKDRIPREAVLAGCCIITGKRGSAENQFDVPILEKYKFEETDTLIIIETIKSILDNYETKFSEFDSYRKSIVNEKKEFVEQLGEFLDVLNA